MVDADATMDIDEEVGEEDAAAPPGDQEFFSGDDVIVIHPGSQNLRVGFASDALPKTVPMAIARQWKCNEWEERGGVEIPKRLKSDDGSEIPPRQMFGEEFATHYDKLCATLKVTMRQNKRKVLPNSKELVVNYNDRMSPEIIPEHNDPHRVEWTEIPSNPKKAPQFFTGEAALRVPDESNPRYKLFWPLQRGWYNEDDYDHKFRLFEDITTIIEEALRTELGIQKRSELANYGCVFVVPDLYDRTYVTQTMDMLMRDLGFAKHIFIQESLAATIGSGNSAGCYVDIGAQKTSVCCVEDGMCIPDSRVNIKIGGQDVTETFIQMMLFDHFPYREINLKRRYDFLLAEELKHKFCTMKEDEISVQLYSFHVRAPDQATKKYQFKTYDEVLLAPQGLFDPTLFDNSRKLNGRRKLIGPSMDQFDDFRNDPISEAQSTIITSISPEATSSQAASNGHSSHDVASTPKRQLPANHAFNIVKAAEPSLTVRDSPAVEADGTPIPAAAGEETETRTLAPCLRDDVLPVVSLDTAILTSIMGAAKGDERRFKDFLKAISVVGGGIKIPGLDHALEVALLKWRPGADIRIIPPSKEMDPQAVVWKGASVLSKVRSSTEYWVSRLEYERLGSRVLNHKCMWSW
jgi:actin-related protein 8